MDLDLIDPNVYGDALAIGDTVLLGRSYHELLSEEGEDSQGKIIYRTHNLSTGDESRKHFDAARTYPVYG